MWLTVLIIAIIIGAIIGFASSDEGERGAGALGGAFVVGMGCLQVLVRIFIFGLTIMAVLWLFGKLFG
ncbi:MAG: hypothetical protein IKX36_01190 [Prevotella sp.]|nr:hypothetical protein [Prevotella sp.]